MRRSTESPRECAPVILLLVPHAMDIFDQDIRSESLMIAEIAAGENLTY
jgi:hypothetical protein